MTKKDPRDRGLFECPKGVWWIRYTDENGKIQKEKIGPKSLARQMRQRRKQEVFAKKKGLDHWEGLIFLSRGGAGRQAGSKKAPPEPPPNPYPDETQIRPTSSPYQGEVVYFLRASAQGPIKIGKARDITRRVATLQTALPDELHLLLTIPGYGHEEAWFHKRFEHLRLRGEWFHADCDLVHFLRAVVKRSYDSKAIKEASLWHCPCCCQHPSGKDKPRDLVCLRGDEDAGLG